MSRFVALVLAALFVFGSAPAASAQSSADIVIGDLDSFWSTEFAAAGREYWSPGIVVLGEPVDTSCGTLSSSFGPGAYCSANGTLYYAPVWFMSFSDGGYDFALMTVLSHEWGHHIQLLLGIQWQADKSYELQADCLSGAYAAHAELVGLAPPGALADSIRLAALSGDVGALPRDAAEHGGGAERAISFMNGYQGGVNGCGIVL
jgi:predicted metalloprotease